ncbi:hypothetical protein [Microbacterium pygmaeum]|uniref:Uncharacterized protein n=1 Tax=Microbacterium pygmaeum TaxID=370764 RepID=A0A1G7XIV5_9MICO|nr:hypothetical protein [Microbacterium pygmaeum]SDG84132.1 hypothetical protein SAMN04489810_1440 [Microbacterium pygmaeum]
MASAKGDDDPPADVKDQRDDKKDQGDEKGVGRDRERARESDRRYAQAHRDRRAANSRRWREAHPEQARAQRRQWKTDNPERSKQLNRESARRSYGRGRRTAAIRSRANESSRRWKQAHPEQVREYRRRWVEANRERVREYYRRYHADNRERVNARATARRDADPEKTKRSRKAWADRNKQRLADYQRAYRSNPDRYATILAANSAAKRLRTRLERAGLPTRRMHKVLAAERRGNDSRANDFFADPFRSEHVNQLMWLSSLLTEHVLADGPRMREFAGSYVAFRARMGLPAIDGEDFLYAHAAQVVSDRMRGIDLLTSRDVAAAVRSARVAVAERERLAQRQAFARRLESHLRRNARRLREDARLEKVVRTHTGKTRSAVEELVLRMAIEEVVSSGGLPSGLTKADLRQVVEAFRRRAVLEVSVDALHVPRLRASQSLGL